MTPPLDPLVPARRVGPILFCGLSNAFVHAVCDRLPRSIVSAQCERPDDARAALATYDRATICAGSDWTLDQVKSVIATADPNRVAVVVTGAGTVLDRFATEVDAGRLFYLARGEPDAAYLAHLLLAAGGLASPADGGAALEREHSAREAEVLERVAWLADRAQLQREVDSVSTLLQQATFDLLGADRATVLLYDPEPCALYAVGADGRMRWESAAVGLASLALRTGMTLTRDRVDRDGCFDREADDPSGHGGERLLAVPIAAGGRKIGVVIAIREAERPPIDASDQGALERLVSQVAPVFDRLQREARLREHAERDAMAMTEQQFSTYRSAAVERYLVRKSEPGQALRLDPLWIRWSFGLLLTSIVLSIVAACVITLTEFASGPAVVRIEGRSEISVSERVAVYAVEVRNGERVVAGQPLLRVRGIEGPNGVIHPFVSPWTGTVTDLRARPGQQLAAGDEVATIVSSDARPYLEVLLPGSLRPLIRVGMPLRLKLDGFQSALVELEIAEIGDEVVGPEEARKRLGPGAETLLIQGPVMPVRARLGSGTFRLQNRDLPLYPGMTGTAHVPVRRRSLMRAILPSVPGLGGEDDV